MRRVLGTVGGSAGVLSTIFAAGWTGMILILAVVVVVTGALCWVIADAKRPARLAMLLRAWRTSAPPTAARGPRRPPRQRR
jgi:drug/metabolite transporter (DMT)-like permease